MTKKLYISILTVGLLVFQSCQELDLVPNDRETEATFWDKPADAFNVLNTCYENMYRADYFFFNETLSDNAFNKSEVDGMNSRNIAEGSYDPSQARVSDEWGYHYFGIRKCNIFLSNIDNVPGLDDALRNRMKGEARFIRAFHYFNLTVWYGDVPLVTTVLSVAESQNITRAPQSEVIAFVDDELDYSASVLPTNTQYAASDRGRITKGAALALKARLALYQQDWSGVLTLTEKFFNGEAGNYSLFSSYAGVFKAQNEYNSEVILDLQYVPVQRTHDVQRFFVPRSQGRLVTSIAPTQELVDSYLMENGLDINDPNSGYDESSPYEGRDPRFYSTIVYDGYEWQKPDGGIEVIRTLPGIDDPNSIDRDDASPTGYYFAKYYDITADASNRSGLNLILIRYAEILMIYAEAKNELSQFDETVWENTIGALRVRAGFSNEAAEYNSDWTESDIERMIHNERRIEFALEGMRIFDIRRWRIAEDVMNGWVHGMRVGDPGVDNGYRRVDLRSFDPSKHYLWPVPQRERDLNKNLSQNSNW